VVFIQLTEQGSSSGVSGEIVEFNTLAIGHTKHQHGQRICSLQKN
jgi:hypothetical protein